MGIEDAIKQLKGIDIKFLLSGSIEQSNYIIDEANKINQAIEIVLGNLEALCDMQKSADKELENAKITIEKLKEENLHWRGQYYLLTRKIGVIPEQKIKDKIDEINKKYEDSKNESGESPFFDPKFTIKTLKKLLQESEDK